MIVRAPEEDKKVSVNLHPLDRRKLRNMTISVLIQCTAVIIGTITITKCLWNPLKVKGDFKILIRIMYLYDYKNCNTEVKDESLITNLFLSNETLGFSDVEPISWTPAVVSISAMLARRFRGHVIASAVCHCFWSLSAILLFIVSKIKFMPLNILQYILNTFLIITLTMVVFDASMAIVYITDIQQALTKGMVLRHSGWSVEITLKSKDDFAGWIPIGASICWLRGVVFFVLNILCLRSILSVKKNIEKKKAYIIIEQEGHSAFPDPRIEEFTDAHVLVLRKEQ